MHLSVSNTKQLVAFSLLVKLETKEHSVKVLLLSVFFVKMELDAHLLHLFKYEAEAVLSQLLIVVQVLTTTPISKSVVGSLSKYSGLNPGLQALHTNANLLVPVVPYLSPATHVDVKPVSSKSYC